MADKEISKRMALEHALVLKAAIRLNAASGPEALAAFSAFLEDIHHAKEEKFLFPAMGKHGFSQVTAGLVSDHARGKLLQQELAACLASKKPDLFLVRKSALFDLLKQHIAKEAKAFAEAEQKLGGDEAGAVLAGFSGIDSAQASCREAFTRRFGQ